MNSHHTFTFRMQQLLVGSMIIFRRLNSTYVGRSYPLAKSGLCQFIKCSTPKWRQQPFKIYIHISKQIDKKYYVSIQFNDCNLIILLNIFYLNIYLFYYWIFWQQTCSLHFWNLITICYVSLWITHDLSLWIAHDMF